MTIGVNGSPNRHHRRIVRALQRVVGRGRPFSVAQLARKSGRSAAAVKAYVAGHRTVPGDVLFRFMEVLPPGFTVEVMAGLGAAKAPSDLELLRDMGAAIGGLAAVAANHRAHRRARILLKPVMNDLAAAVSAWSEAA